MAPALAAAAFMTLMLPCRQHTTLGAALQAAHNSWCCFLFCKGDAWEYEVFHGHLGRHSETLLGIAQHAALYPSCISLSLV